MRQLLNIMALWQHQPVQWQCNVFIFNKQELYNIAETKLSHYRPGQDLGVPGASRSQISRQSAHEGGKVVSPRHRLPLPPGNIPGTHFC